MPALLMLASTLLFASPPLPGVDVKNLDEGELAGLVTLLDEGACPCEPQKSLLQCVQAKTCVEATALASYGVTKIREGMSADQVVEAVVKKYVEEYVLYTFNVSRSPRKGPSDAKIVIVEFADFECPHCALMVDVMKAVMAKHPQDVAVVFKQFPLPHHTQALKASKAALAAHRQGKFWDMHDRIFANQASLSDSKLETFATELGLDLARFKKDYDDPTVMSEIAADKKEAMAANIMGTPALYINGRMYIDEKSPEKISEYILRLLKTTP